MQIGNFQYAERGFRGSGFGVRVKRQNASAILLTRNPKPQTPNPRFRGFTLVEMMVVVAIIIVLVSLAIPVVHALTGNNSLAAGANRISAMLSVARSDAIINRQITGVFFFVDPVTKQVAMAEVMPNQVYSGQLPTGAPIAPGTTTLMAETVPGSTGVPTPTNVPSLELVYSWQVNPNATIASPEPMTKYYYRDVELLPKGVGVALANNNYAPSVGMNALDRYMRLGAIMFNTDGTLFQMTYGVAGTANPVTNKPYSNLETPTNELGINHLLLSSSNLLLGTSLCSVVNDQYLTSEVGMILYDRDAYLAQTTNTLQQYIPGTGQPFNDLDLEYGVTQPIPNDKRQEENWLDQNSVSYLVSPFNGDLVRSK